jgi:xanthine dehydrogenase accessory factor
VTSDGLFEEFANRVRDDRPIALATVIDGPRGPGAKMLLDPSGAIRGSLGGADVDDAVVRLSKELFAAHRSTAVEVDGARIFVDVHVPAPRLVIVGAVHIATTLGRLARELGFRVVVCDARGRFATPERFPDVDELILGWPSEVLPKLALDESSYVVVVTHDAKLDNPALMAALRSPAPYVGALGSKKTHARRLKALREAGASEEDMERIHSPIGLDIGAGSPQEIALAILAEIVAVRNAARTGAG